MKSRRFGGFKVLPLFLLVSIVPMSRGDATQLDFKGSERITDQIWSLEFTLRSMGEEDFSVRLPFPNYTYVGKWVTYSTHEVIVDAVGECGPITFELYHYNQGYSNQGVWLKPIFTCSDSRIYLTVKQSAKLDLPGIDYPLTFHTNNPWMDGSDIVDVNSPVVAAVLSEALAMTGDWHQRGGRGVPEKIVNWMNENMSWSGGYAYYPKPASQVLTERYGHCEEWAHAACALLIKAGIPAKTVLVGMLPTYNSTTLVFDEAAWHLCAAYWDGYGWILIDPQQSSGFGIPNRVILGADRDSWNIRMKTNPEYLYFDIQYPQFAHDGGSYSGGLNLVSARCYLYTAQILEHYEYPSGSSPPGFEPIANIIPNIPTDAEVDFPVAAGMQFSNYPNPFNPVTTFRFVVNRPGNVRIVLYSVDGRRIETVFNRYCDSGLQEIPWNSSAIPSGIYFARVSTTAGKEAKKIVILR